MKKKLKAKKCNNTLIIVKKGYSVLILSFLLVTRMNNPKIIDAIKILPK